ncbi:DMT family transporter [Candidatus Woesearchaeota archaeon]|nr:DMT family transporter [Candidatus Woesearchaeota archaeon]
MILGILYAILSAVAFGISNVIMKHMTIKIDKLALMTIRSTFTLITFIPLLFFADFILPSFKESIIIVAIGLIGAIAYYYFVKAIELSTVSIISAITRTSALITVILSVFLFNEELKLMQYFAILAVLAGIILLTIDLKKLNTEQLLQEKKALFISLFVTLLWGIMYFLMKYSVTAVGSIYTAFYLEFFVFFFIALLLLKENNRIQFQESARKIINEKKMIVIIFFIGLLTTLGSLLYSFAISLIYVSIAITLINMSPLITAIVARIFINERLSTKQIIGMIMTIIGVIIISL